MLPATLVVGALVAVPATYLFAANEPSSMTHPASTLSYLRLYPDAAGVTHFAAEELALQPIGVTGVEAALAVHRLGNVQGAMFAMLKRGAVEDWHPAPRRQFMIALRGVVEVQAGDGESRRLTPGMILLLEDTSGKGHVTRSVGTEDHVALAVPYPADQK
jgi:quercetin dioxygenase-like cupin family protein